MPHFHKNPGAFPKDELGLRTPDGRYDLNKVDAGVEEEEEEIFFPLSIVSVLNCLGLVENR